MKHNILIYRGEYEDIREIRERLKEFQSNKKNSSLYHENTTKYLKKVQILDEYQREYLYEIKLSFQYPKSNYRELLQDLERPKLEMGHMCWDDKKAIWIVNDARYITEFKFIPEFALHKILFEYMQYKESAIILDSFETIKYDQNTNRVIINDKNYNYEELLNLFFTKSIKGKKLYIFLEEFTHNYYLKCINNYDDIATKSGEIPKNNEEPSALGLFIVTFGIIGIILIIIKLMDFI